MRALIALILASAPLLLPAQTGLRYWLTTPDRQQLLAAQPAVPFTPTPPSAELLQIQVDTAQRYQEMAGFGLTFTGGSAQVIRQYLSAERQEALLRELFLPGPAGLGLSYLRLSVGASDLNAFAYTYCDASEPDTLLRTFSLGPDEQDLLPLLRQVQALQPQLRLMATPWSAPAWMKDPATLLGGQLRPSYQGAYARYLVRYLQAMATAGLPLTTLTIQNEPENGHNNPSMLMPAPEQAAFIKNHLGPALAAAGLSTQLLIFDHNCDHPEYPLSILADTLARRYVAGTAFHLYAGEPAAMSRVHDAFPDKDLYFTEQWVSAKGNFGGDLAWHAQNVLIGAARNWAKTIMEWNLAADEYQRPYTPGGCKDCLGAVTVTTTGQVRRNVAYYVLGHGAKWVPPGSVRIASTALSALPNVAFRRPDGQIALVVFNAQAKAQRLAVGQGNQWAVLTLPPGALATLVW